MRKLLLTAVFSVPVEIAVYAGIWSPQMEEYEFTVVEKVGLFSQPAATTSASTQFNSVTKTFFRRADGTSGFIIRETRKGKTAISALYRSPTDNAQIAVQVNGGIRTTHPVPPYLARAWVSAAVLSDCTGRNVGYERVGDIQLLGTRAQHFKLANPTEEADIYLSPALGCVELKSHHLWKGPDGTFVSWTDIDLVDLKLGPPDPGYFGLEAGARETPPSEARAAIHGVLFPDLPMATCWKNASALADAQYRRAQESAANGSPSETPAAPR